MDIDQIQQVLVNIFLNSCQAMPQGGEITIRVYTDTISKKGHYNPTNGIAYPELLLQFIEPGNGYLF